MKILFFPFLLTFCFLSTQTKAQVSVNFYDSFTGGGIGIREYTQVVPIGPGTVTVRVDFASDGMWPGDFYIGNTDGLTKIDMFLTNDNGAGSRRFQGTVRWNALSYYVVYNRMPYTAPDGQVGWYMTIAVTVNVVS